MRNLAIIPARGGSKRIPRKNIKGFLGKPIIAYSIEAALRSGLFEEVMVSTDDKEIAEIAQKYGAKVPFMRSTKNSDDYTGPGDVVYEVIHEYEKMGQEFDYGCCIYATAPLMTEARLTEGLKLLSNSNYNVVFPVGKFCSPIWRSFKLNTESGVELNFPEYETKRSQDLPTAYYDAGQFYWFHIKNMAILKNKNVFGTVKGAILLEDFEVQDIDNIDDWHMTEIKFSFLKNRS